MRFFVDECLSRHFVSDLRKSGHDVEWAQDVCPGADDVLELATNGDRIVISEDWDFGELVVRFALPAKGVVIVPVNVFDLSLEETSRYAVQVIDKLGQNCLGMLTIVEPHKTRQRPLSRS